jgi:hypothetical protein
MDYDGHGVLSRIIKSSSQLMGINNIQAEIRGLDWYSDISGAVIKYDSFAFENRYINLSIEAVEGLIDTSRTPSYTNYIEYIPKVIRHYCDIWGQCTSDSQYPLHGDMSLVGNILFQDSYSPVLIDWEHFHEDAAPLGFDALYCMFELVQFEIINDERLLDSNLDHLLRMIVILIENGCVDQSLLESPLRAIINFMHTNCHLWGEQYTKFPVLLFTDENVLYIDAYLNDRLQNHKLQNI